MQGIAFIQAFGDTIQMDARAEHIKTRILFPVTVAGALLILLSLTGAYMLQRKAVTDSVAQRVSGSNRLLAELIREESQIMSGQIDFLKADPALIDPFMAKDRSLLAERALPIFERMRSRYRITHFYFHSEDRTCFLRVHSPDRHGDLIDRFTMKGAVSNNRPFYGIELGPLGTFTLRSVYPWTVNGVLVGYIELGMEIEHLILLIKQSLNLEMLVLIEKQYLTRHDWESGLEVLGRDGSWDLFQDFVVINETVETSPDLEQKLSIHQKEEHAAFSIELKNRYYMAEGRDLFDAGNRRVGELVNLVDVTSHHRYLWTLILLISGLSLGVGAALLLFFARYIGGIEKELVLSREHLRLEIELRRQSEKALSVSEKQYRSIFEESMDAIVSTDMHGNLLMINPAGKELFGFTNVDWKSNSFIDLYIEPAISRRFTVTMRDKGFVKDFGVKLKGKDHRIMECLMTVTARRSMDGSLEGYEGIVRDVTPFKEMEAELRRLATTDTLTGINNRGHFMELAQREISRSHRYSRACSFVMLDIDHFKKINDSYGHSTGDSVLREFCDVCLNQLRESDIMGRIGGEEFAIVLPECSGVSAEEVAGRIRSAVESHTIITNSRAIRFTVSLGVAEFCSDDGLESIQERADRALYLAKENGRNQVRVCKPKCVAA